MVNRAHADPGYFLHSPVCVPACRSTAHAPRAQRERRSSFTTPAESPGTAPDVTHPAQPMISHAQAPSRSSPPSWRLAALRFSQRTHPCPSPASSARSSSNESRSPTKLERFSVMLLTRVDQDGPDDRRLNGLDGDAGAPASIASIGRGHGDTAPPCPRPAFGGVALLPIDSIEAAARRPPPAMDMERGKTSPWLDTPY